MDKSKFLLSAIILFYSGIAIGQSDFSAKIWHYIDTSIAKKNNLSHLLTDVNQLEIKAREQQKHFFRARCLNYRMLINDRRSEDSFYFKNSAFIDTLLLQTAIAKPLQYSLHIMQAYRVLNFKSGYKRFQLARYSRKDIPVDYASFSDNVLDTIVRYHFEKAKEISLSIIGENADEALWLSSDALQFLFKPGLFDIAIAAQIRAIQKEYYYTATGNFDYKPWLNLSQDEFIGKINSIQKEKNDLSEELMLYSNWIKQQQSNPSAAYFIETLAKKYIYDLSKQRDPEVELMYEDYLKKIIVSPHTTVRAFAVYQLCLLLNKQAKNYFPSNGYGYSSNDFWDKAHEDYNNSFRYYPAKALKLFQQNKSLLDSFAYLKNILLQMEDKIREEDATISAEDYILPGEPVLAELKFKNIKEIFYRIVKVNTGADLNYTNHNKLVSELKTMPIVAENHFFLPATTDYNYHNTYLKLEALPPGDYRLLFAGKNLSDSTARIGLLGLSVTNIAIVNNDKRVYIVNRKTGFPLTGAKVKAGYTKTVKKDTVTTKEFVFENYFVNKNGYIIVKNDDYSELTVYNNNDTLSDNIDIREEANAPEDVYTKDEYENLVEFYVDNAKAYIYTDRSIYRPGQTVFYKAIFITKNKNTGEPMLMNKQNMGGKLFNSVYKKWLTEEEPYLVVKDPFGRAMDSLKIAPGEFGSLSGTFKIPKTASTGDWEIEPDYIDKDWNYGMFKVEEYKRPSYELTIESPQKELRIGDEFSFKVKVKSFAGATLSNVKINYTVIRTGGIPGFNPALLKLANRNYTDTLLSSTGYTTPDGELIIEVKDSILKDVILADSIESNYRYSLNAEAVDATGESYEEEADVTISSRPIRIKWPLVDKYNRSDLPSLVIKAEDKNSGLVNKPVTIKFYKLNSNEKLHSGRKLTMADEWIYDNKLMKEWFPMIDFKGIEEPEQKILIWEKTINTGENEKIVLPSQKFTAGNYIVEAVSKENGKIVGTSSKNFAVYDVRENKLPDETFGFYHLPFNSAIAGDSVKYFSGSSIGATFSIFYTTWYSTDKRTGIKYSYEEKETTAGIHQYTFKIPASATDYYKVSQVFVSNNQVYTYEGTIYVSSKNVQQEPEIIVEKYRKKLSPGTKEEFSVSIKTNNENIAAELMTTMYDASLDKLEEHKWEKPRERNYRSLNTNWPNSINSTTKSTSDVNGIYESLFVTGKPEAKSPLWWVNPLDYEYTEIMGDWNYNRKARFNGGFDFDMRPATVERISGRLAGVDISYASGLEEVVVVAATRVSARTLGYSTRMVLRGASTISANNIPLIILDGIPYTGDLSKLDPALITEMVILKGVDASSLYGSRASGGVLVMSTTGKIIFPNEAEPVITPRKNFNESAFFFPAVHADKNGFYSFSFTMPESVTEWNWKMLAQTKLGKFAYAERKLNTQLPLIVQPNLPRLVYQGDRVVLQSRISNLDTLTSTGIIVCKIEDAVTGNDITSQLISGSQQNFSVNKKENIAKAFEIKVPSQQLNPLKITITVRSGSFADGEEHILPVLSPKIFVRDNKAFYFKQNQDTVLQLVALPKDAELYGMGLFIQTKPQAALINSLPWLANYPYGCAEQTFNKMLAYITAVKIMRTDKEAQRAFDVAKKNIENENEKSEKLPDELNEETMPWLNHANKSSLQQKRLFNLLDTSKSIPAIDDFLQKLYKLQNPDGGISWFNGGESSTYISAYILRGFGKMRNGNLFAFNRANVTQYDKFIQNLIAYNDRVFINGENETYSNHLYYIYARSYWQQQNPLSDSLAEKVKKYLRKEWDSTNRKTLYNQSLNIIATLRFANKNEDLFNRATAELSSIKQLAIIDEQNGIRWKDLADADDLNTLSEETIALLAEAFDEAANDNTTQQGIVKWLLTAKNEHSWGSTKATAAAISLLLNTNKPAIGETQTLHTTIGDKKIMVNDDMMSNLSSAFLPVAELPSQLQVKKEKATAASGNINWYYFTAAASLSYLNKDVQLSKTFYRWDDKGNKWTPVAADAVLKIADKIKVVVTITSSKALPFIFIDDKRAAAFEPLENSSGYQYGAGFSYYKSVRDAGFNFFAENIPSGRHEISYELKVAQEGSFTSGPASLQCMYKPEVTAYSNSNKFITAH